jgi:hypothetical protein
MGMEAIATISILLATLALLALLAGASHRLHLPTRTARARTWTTAVAITGALGGAVALGGILARAENFAATTIGVTALLLVVELALFSDAFTFGSRDR